MAKYDLLREHLERSRSPSLLLTFSQIDKIVGGLPVTAYQRDEWWANEDVQITRHTQCKSWQRAGYTVTVDRRAKTARFHRK